MRVIFHWKPSNWVRAAEFIYREGCCRYALSITDFDEPAALNETLEIMERYGWVGAASECQVDLEKCSSHSAHYFVDGTKFHYYKALDEWSFRVLFLDYMLGADLLFCSSSRVDPKTIRTFIDHDDSSDGNLAFGDVSEFNRSFLQAAEAVVLLGSIDVRDTLTISMDGKDAEFLEQLSLDSGDSLYFSSAPPHYVDSYIFVPSLSNDYGEVEGA